MPDSMSFVNVLIFNRPGHVTFHNLNLRNFDNSTMWIWGTSTCFSTIWISGISTILSTLWITGFTTRLQHLSRFFFVYLSFVRTSTVRLSSGKAFFGRTISFDFSDAVMFRGSDLSDHLCVHQVSYSYSWESEVYFFQKINHVYITRMRFRYSP